MSKFSRARNKRKREARRTFRVKQQRVFSEQERMRRLKLQVFAEECLAAFTALALEDYDATQKEQQRKKEEDLWRIYQSQCEECASDADILKCDERILSVEVQDNVLIFTTNWITSIEFLGKQVKVGRFRAVLNAEAANLNVEWIEKSCPESIHPRYHLKPEFCFGRRRQYLLDLVRAREYLAAAYGMLDSLSHINPEDYEYVLTNYEKIVKVEHKRTPDRWMNNVFRQ